MYTLTMLCYIFWYDASFSALESPLFKLFGPEPVMLWKGAYCANHWATPIHLMLNLQVCMSLKRSSIIHQTYIIKNILEMLMLGVFIPVNLIYAVEVIVFERISTDTVYTVLCHEYEKTPKQLECSRTSIKKKICKDWKILS